MNTSAPAELGTPPGALAPPAVPITRAERSLAPDIARGAMLLFIAVANVGIYLWGRGLDAYGHIADAATVDRVALFAEQLLMAERSRPMFAILYGFGIAVMASRMRARGLDAKGIRKVLRRRSWWLIVLGALHGVLLFLGDILGAYGATGLIALGLVHLSDRALRRWLVATGAYVVLGYTTLLALMLSGALEVADVATGAEPLATSYLGFALLGAMAGAANIAMALLLAAFVPLVIVGMMLRRAGWLDHPAQHLPGLRRVFWSAMAVNLASSLPVALIGLGVWHPGTGATFAAFYVTLLGGMYAGMGYICGFALLAHRLSRQGRRGVPGALAALGERSLTGYLGQSIIMAPLLTPWGLALGEGMGYLAAYGVAIGAWAITVVAAVIMDRRGVRGPFEVLLRRRTYRTGQDFAR